MALRAVVVVTLALVLVGVTPAAMAPASFPPHMVAHDGDAASGWVDGQVPWWANPAFMDERYSQDHIPHVAVQGKSVLGVGAQLRYPSGGGAVVVVQT